MKKPFLGNAKDVKRSELAEQLGRRIENGEERTSAEWAALLLSHLEDSEKARSRISYALSILRKKGFMYFSVEHMGPIKDVTRSAVDFNFVYNRYMGKKVEPQLMRSFEYAERLIQQFPKLRESVIERAKGLMKVANEQNKALLGIPFKSPR